MRSNQELSRRWHNVHNTDPEDKGGFNLCKWEGIAMEGVADVMESMYRTLTENSGNDAIDAVILAKN